MNTLPVCTVLALVALSTREQRIEPIYREGSAIVLVAEESLEMETDEITVAVNGMELPPEAVEEMGIPRPESHDASVVRVRDEVVATAGTRPVRVRRTFEQLLERSRDEDGETERTGPLEGLTLVLSEEDGETLVALDDEADGADLDDTALEAALEGHVLTHDVDAALPDEPVEVGDSWTLDATDARRLVGLDSGPVLFPPDDPEQSDLFRDVLEQGAEVSGTAELVALEERDGLRCAVVDVTIELEAAFEGGEVFGFEPQEGMELVSATGRIELTMQARIWYASAEGRPVASEETLEGGIACQLEMQVSAEGQEFSIAVELGCSLSGASEKAWTVPE